MQIGEVIINMVTKQTFKYNDDDVPTLFSGRGYPDSWGFYYLDEQDENFDKDYWIENFKRHSSQYTFKQSKCRDITGIEREKFYERFERTKRRRIENRRTAELS